MPNPKKSEQDVMRDRAIVCLCCLMFSVLALIGWYVYSDYAKAQAVKATQQIIASQNQALESPDKIEEVITTEGKPTIKIYGQKEAIRYQRLQQQKTSYASEASYNRDTYAGLPSIQPRISKKYDGVAQWYFIETDHFLIEIENNEAFGVKTAEMLEAFNALLQLRNS